MEFVSLNKALAKIQDNADVRTYLKAVAQDPQNETIDYAKTKQDVESVMVEEAFTARLTLITNLNNIFFLLHALGEDEKHTETTRVWLWENHTRLNKMIAAAMVLEGNNLRTFGATPEKSDIPQSLVRLNVWICESGMFFESLAKAYADIMTEKGSDDFYALYTDQK